MEEEIKAPKFQNLEAFGVVFGTFLANFISVGIANTLGVILHGEEYENSSPFIHVDLFKMGFVAGTAIGFSFIAGPFSNLLVTKFGIRAPIALGVFLMTFALEMASLATKFYQLLLSQGILWGFGSSLCFVPAISLPSQWFSAKRKGVATGFAASGAPVGAMILSPAFQAIVTGISVQWALRILGFIVLGLGAITVTLVHAKRNVKITRYKMFDIEVLRTRGYPLYMLFAFIQMFGYVMPIYWLPNYARSIGLNSKQGANLVVILNAGNIVGRIGSGLLGDRLGPLNVLFTLTFFAGLLCVVAWLFATTFAGLASFAVFWGVGAGAYWALTVPCTLRIIGMQRLGSAVSINFLMNFIPPIFTPSIGTALINVAAKKLEIPSSDSRAFRYLIIFAGLAYMIAALILLIVRLMIERKVLKSV